MASAKAKPWQIMVLALGGMAAVGSAGYFALFSGDTIQFADSITMVDVATGELFQFSVGGGRAVIVPELNPSTGKRNLLGVEKTAEGKWALTVRSISQLSSVADEPKAVVDRRTGEVRISSESVSPGRP
jgi:hypothetical protein